MVIHYLTKGLHASLLPHVIRRHPMTPTDFLLIAQDEEKLQLTLNGLSHASTSSSDNYLNDDTPLDHMVNLVNRPANTQVRSSNWRQHQSPPQPLMNLSPAPPLYSSSPRRYDDPQQPSSGPVRQCYSCSCFGHIAKYCPNRKNV
jgi:hypothetical protein